MNTNLSKTTHLLYLPLNNLDTTRKFLQVIECSVVWNYSKYGLIIQKNYAKFLRYIIPNQVHTILAISSNN